MPPCTSAQHKRRAHARLPRIQANDYVSVVDLERVRLTKHPWSMGGGGAAELKEMLDRRGQSALQVKINLPIGRAVRIGADELFEMTEVQRRHSAAPTSDFRPYLVGESVRDWSAIPDRWVWYPYSRWSGRFLLERLPWRTPLRGRRTF